MSNFTYIESSYMGNKIRLVASHPLYSRIIELGVSLANVATEEARSKYSGSLGSQKLEELHTEAQVALWASKMLSSQFAAFDKEATTPEEAPRFRSTAKNLEWLIGNEWVSGSEFERVFKHRLQLLQTYTPTTKKSGNVTVKAGKGTFKLKHYLADKSPALALLLSNRERAQLQLDAIRKANVEVAGKAAEINQKYDAEEATLLAQIAASSTALETMDESLKLIVGDTMKAGIATLEAKVADLKKARALALAAVGAKDTQHIESEIDSYNDAVSALIAVAPFKAHYEEYLAWQEAQAKAGDAPF